MFWATGANTTGTSFFRPHTYAYMGDGDAGSCGLSNGLEEATTHPN